MVSFIAKALQPGFSAEGGLLLLFIAIAVGVAIGTAASLLCAAHRERKELE